MYYDLIASLPHLPHFAQAERSPITGLRLEQRLRLLTPAHAHQLARARSVVGWRPDRVLGTTDAARATEYAVLMTSPLDRSLREYIVFRMDQQTLVAALRRKHNSLGLPDRSVPWGVGPRVRHVERHWDESDFRLAILYPWLPKARDLLAAGVARDLQRLLMEEVWRWLDRCAERNMFGFEAVFSYCFKWDILQVWLVCDVERAKTRFKHLIDQVTNVENSERCG